MQSKKPEDTGQSNGASGGVADRKPGLVSDLSVCRLIPSPISPIEASLATLVIVAIAPLVAHLAARLYAGFFGLGQAGVSVPGSIEGHLMAYEAVYVAALNLAMIGLTFAGVRRLGRPVAETLALNAPEDGWRAYAFALLIAGLATVLWFAVLLQLMPDAVVADFLPYKDMMERERSWLMPPILCILAPVAEELLFVNGGVFSGQCGGVKVGH
jgi:membrane protease YdiL (CAAX protease family)